MQLSQSDTRRSTTRELIGSIPAVHKHRCDHQLRHQKRYRQRVKKHLTLAPINSLHGLRFLP